MSPRARFACACALAVAALGALPASGLAGGSCVVPRLVGVSYRLARATLARSGCAVLVRELPGHGRYVSPSRPDPVQIVGAQSPAAGGHGSMVTISLKPLCSQPALPGPATVGPTSARGPAELVVGLYLSGGPLRRRATCATGTPAAAAFTVTTASGESLTARSVRAGRFAVFPLPPGRYVVSGSLAPDTSPSPGAQQRPFTIVAGRTTRLNLLAPVG